MFTVALKPLPDVRTISASGNPRGRSVILMVHPVERGLPANVRLAILFRGIFRPRFSVTFTADVAYEENPTAGTVGARGGPFVAGQGADRSPKK